MYLLLADAELAFVSGRCLRGIEAEANEEGAGEGAGVGNPIPKKLALLLLLVLLFCSTPNLAIGSIWAAKPAGGCCIVFGRFCCCW